MENNVGSDGDSDQSTVPMVVEPSDIWTPDHYDKRPI